MLIPYKTNVYLPREPSANIVLIGIMGFFYLLFWLGNRSIISAFALDPSAIFLTSLTYWLVHAGFFHFLGNMFFLWTFGNAICSRMTDISYAITFVSLASISALGHSLFYNERGVGASGAINGIVGIFLYLFPFEKISCFWLIIGRGATFEVRAIYLILAWFAFDLLGAFAKKGNVAYLGHIIGLVAGFVLALVLSKLEILEVNADDRPLIT